MSDSHTRQAAPCSMQDAAITETEVFATGPKRCRDLAGDEHAVHVRARELALA